MRNIVRGAIAALAMGAAGASAQAADLGAIKGPPPPPPVVDTFQPFQIRLKMGAVVPTNGAATIFDRGNGTYTNALGIPTNQTMLQFLGYSGGAGSVFGGASTTISWSVIPMLDVAYYFNKNWAIEAICCISQHHVQGTGSIGIGSPSVIKSWVFPPSLMLQYHFTNFGHFQPYLGVGVNFTAFWGTRAGNQQFPFFSPLLGPTGFNTAYSASITPSWGVVGQAGFDWMFNEHWGVNADVKYIMMEPKAHVWAVNNATLPVPLYVPLNLNVPINPIVASVGLTYRFGGGMAIPGLSALGGVLPQF